MPVVRVRTDGIYSGLRDDGRPWPEFLYGIREIAGALRRSPDTISNWLRAGRLPACLDPSGRWMTSRRLIELWILERRRQQMSMPKGRRPRGTGRGARKSLRELDELASIALAAGPLMASGEEAED